MTLMYDIIIIGAGPAGSTLARSLDKKYKVLLIDKRNLDNDPGYLREKCCGGLLAPAAQKELARQGLGIPADIMVGPQTFSVKSIDFDNGITKFYQRHYINIDREKFDRWLISLVPDTVKTEFSSLYKSFSEEEGVYTVFYETEGIKKEARSRILIGADGAASKIRSQVFTDKMVPEKYISVQEHFKTDNELPYYVSVFDGETTDFYSWIIQKNDELLVGSALRSGTLADEKYRRLIKKLMEESYIKGAPVKRSGALIMRPENLGQLCVYRNNIALAGEAAGLISPSSAEGISYALKSGVILASAINHSPEAFGKLYEKRLFKLKINLLYKKLKVLVMYNKFLRRLVMKSGILSMDVTEVKGHD